MTFQAPLPEDGGDSRQCLGTRCVFVLQKHAAECRMFGGAAEGQRLNIPFFFSFFFFVCVWHRWRHASGCISVYDLMLPHLTSSEFKRLKLHSHRLYLIHSQLVKRKGLMCGQN